MTDLPHSKFLHLYALVRFDLPINSENPENSVTVVKVFSSEAAAEQEVSRLSEVNNEKDCSYKVFIARFVS